MCLDLSRLPRGALVDPTTFAELAGPYTDPRDVGTLEVTLDGGTLNIRMPSLDQAGVPYRRELVPVARDSFELEVQEFRLMATFVRDANGQPEFFRTRPFVARRGSSVSNSSRLTLSLSELRAAAADYQAASLFRVR